LPDFASASNGQSERKKDETLNIALVGVVPCDRPGIARTRRAAWDIVRSLGTVVAPTIIEAPSADMLRKSAFSGRLDG